MIPLFLMYACTKEKNKCVESMIEEFIDANQDRGFTFIYQFEQDGETYTIFDNGIAFDAIANVINAQCQVVCSYGGFRANNDNPCTRYQDAINQARQIWPD